MEIVPTELEVVMKDMRTSIEVEGATVEEAIKKALNIMQVKRDEVNVKVVSEEQKGLFGMEGAKLAKIIVSLKKEKGC